MAQLLCAEYKVPWNEYLPAEIARTIHQYAAIENGRMLYISDAWWTAVTQLLPAGPKPMLLVLVTCRKRLNKDRCAIFRTPGATDSKILTVVGDGSHFDPVWWEVNGAILAASPGGLPTLPRLNHNYSPDMGAAAAVLLLLKTDHQGCFGFQYGDAQALTEENFDALLERGEAPRVVRMVSQQPGIRATPPPFGVIIIGCNVPSATFINSDQTAEGADLRGLIKRTYVDASVAFSPTPTTIIISYDNNMCHVGRLDSAYALTALTRLQRSGARLVTEGHQGP